MRWRLIGKNVKLETLVSIVRDFFSEKSFVERRALRANKKEQMEFEARRDGRLRSVKGTVIHLQDGFEIEFAPGESVLTLAKLSALTAPFTGGFFLRDKIRNINPGFFERLEADFWDFVDMRVSPEQRDTKA